MTSASDIMHDVRRGEKALSLISKDNSELVRFGIGEAEFDWFLRNALPTLRYRVETLELVDELTESLYQRLMGFIGKIDPVIKVQIKWGFYDTLPDPNGIVYQFSRLVDTQSGSFGLNFTQAAEGKYIAFSQPVNEPDKTKWYNTDLNRGNGIPDATFYGKVILAGQEIVRSRDPFIFQSTIYNITFST